MIHSDQGEEDKKTNISKRRKKSHFKAASRSHSVDAKAIPFRAMYKTFTWGSPGEPIHAMNYMGENYALASEETYTGATTPNFAAWRREARKVERVEHFGVLKLQGRFNEAPPNYWDETPFGALQHDNKLVWAVKPMERHIAATNPRRGNIENGEILSFKAQATLMSYGPDDVREVYVNDRRVTGFPATAAHRDVITIREGVTYIGLIPLPATDMGRREEVVIRSEWPFLTVDAYVLERDEPVQNDDHATWTGLQDATAGWIVELGDVTEHGSFSAFQQHMRRARLKSEWDRDVRVLHLSYASGGDVMEMGFRTTFERDRLRHHILPPSRVFAYRRVNGEWPWLPADIYADDPLGQMGTAPELVTGGATLRTAQGQMAFLRREPVSSTYTGINPFLDPTAFRLTTPEGVEVISEGPLTLARVVARVGANELRVDYHLPEAVHAEALRRLREEMVLGTDGHYMCPAHLRVLEEMSPQTGDRLEKTRPCPQAPFFPAGDMAPENIARLAARALLVRGFDGQPRVILNGLEVPGPFAEFSRHGIPYVRVPIAP